MKAAVAERGQLAVPERVDETSLESFVAQLHREGVAAGQRDAERIINDAREQADEILRRATAEAEAIGAGAREQAAREQERAEAELRLAARDTLLQLQSAVDRALNSLLRAAVGGVMEDREYVARLAAQVVSAYAAADAVDRPVSVLLPPAAAAELEAWTARLLAAGLREDAQVTASLREAGFEYRLAKGGTVEVNAAGIVERLQEFLRPRLRSVIAAAVQDAAPHAPDRVGGTRAGH